jgi:hypothetical protein
MKAWVSAEPAESSRPKRGTRSGVLEKFLRSFAQIGAAVIKPTKYFLRAKYPASDEKRVESTLEEAGAVAAAPETAVLTTTKSFTVPDTAEVKVHTDAQIESADQEEIQRRRDFVCSLKEIICLLINSVFRRMTQKLFVQLGVTPRRRRHCVLKPLGIILHCMLSSFLDLNVLLNTCQRFFVGHDCNPAVSREFRRLVL